jgi:hypothetical protein
MIGQPRDLMYALVQGATERNVHLLKPAAHSKHRYATRDRTRYQRQRGRIAMRIVQSASHTRGARVSDRFHVRRTAREKNAIHALEDFRHVERRLENRNQQRQTVGGLDDSRNVLLTNRMKRMWSDHASIGGNANDGSVFHKQLRHAFTRIEDPGAVYYLLRTRRCDLGEDSH